jgi:hypothetical protein
VDLASNGKRHSTNEHRPELSVLAKLPTTKRVLNITPQTRNSKQLPGEGRDNKPEVQQLDQADQRDQ